MSACQKAAQQARDILAHQAKMDQDCGCDGGCPETGRPKKTAPKKQKCTKQGPGCKNAACTKAADMAVDIINATADFSDGIPEFMFEDYRRVRMLGGVDPNALGFGKMGGFKPAGSILGAEGGAAPALAALGGWSGVGASSSHLKSGRLWGLPVRDLEFDPDGEPEVADRSLFSAPPIEDWGNALGAPCVGAGLGDTSCPPPPLDYRFGATVCRQGEINGSYYGCSDNFANAIDQAWCILNENQDLIEWIVCRVFGKSGACLTTLAGGPFGSLWQFHRSPTAWLKCTSDPDSLACAGTAFGTSLGEMAVTTFCSTSGDVHLYARGNRCGTDEGKLCIAIDLAALMFHEWTHGCLLNTNDKRSEVSRCQLTSYMAENSFKWALLKRYQFAMQSDCCSDRYGRDDHPRKVSPHLFMSTDGTSLNQGICRDRFDASC